jgi:acyl carrier protein
MASESTIAIQIRTALAHHLKRDVSKIRPQDRLREDLGLDSLAMIELLFKIEEHFDLEIPNEDLSRVTTVADVTAYVEGKLDGGAAAPATPAAPARPAVPAVAPAPAAPAPAPGATVRRAPDSGAKAAAAARPPAKVRSIKSAKRKSAPASSRAAGKKKGSRPA